MKRLVSATLAFIALANASNAEKWPDGALEAANAYEEGRYAEAASGYEAAVLAGVRRPEILYNLGVARYRAAPEDSAALVAARDAFGRAASSGGAGLEARSIYNGATVSARLGDLGAALGAYKDALRRDPTDDDARFNLELVQRMLDEQPPREPSPDADEGSEEENDGEGDESEPRSGEQPESGDESDREPDESSAEPETEPGPEGAESGEPPEPAGEPAPGEPSPPPEETEGVSPEEALRELDKLDEAERELLRQLFMRRQRRIDVEKDW